MTQVLQYVEAHPWWTFIYLALITGFIRASIRIVVNSIESGLRRASK